DGSGHFTDSGQNLGTQDSYGISVGDVDGDGDLDVVVANSGQTDRVMLNDGSGNFSIGFEFPSGFSADLVLADLDGDGDLDVYTGILNNPNKVYLNDGEGSFTDTGQLLGDYQTLGVSAGDIDGDGDIDVFEAIGENKNNRFWINDGTGQFTEGQQTGRIRSWHGSLGDIDGDGDLDLIESRVSGSFLFINDGAGNFSGETQLGDLESYHSVLVDMDGDGDLDIVEGNYDEGSGLPNRVLLNDGAGNFTDSGQRLGMAKTHALDAGDIDGDGDLDIVEGAYFDNNQVWFNGANPVELSVDLSTGSEAAGSVITVTATTGVAVATDQTVDLSVSGSGVEASDYQLASSQLTIPVGSSSASTSFTVLDDDLNEGDETAVLAISAVSSALLIGPISEQSVLLIDDDPLPSVSAMSFSAASFSETGAAISLSLSLDRASVSDQCYSVDFTGTAVLGSDYSSSDDDGAAGIQACASAGSTSAQLSITPIDDATYEGDESLSASSGSGLASTTLSDLEDFPTLTALAFDPASISENGGLSQLTATQSNLANVAVCHLLSVSGSATAGVDYQLVDDDPGAAVRLCVNAGELTRSVALSAMDDGVFEGDEVVQVERLGVLAGLSLIDDEGAPSVVAMSFSAASFSETGAPISLTLTLDHSATTEQCFDVSFAGVATLASDY
ncbi:MAG: VCBS repeat-containing protein, partial [Xanthomonadales bacterium]|nr:VCBS repeat-containing protein [Xanthomonadales bacterium]